VYIADAAIARSMKCIFENKVAKATIDPIARPSDEDLLKIKTQKGFRLCSEQMKAFLYCMAYPMVVANGSGGAGKTDCMDSIKTLYPIEQIMATAFQTVNVAALEKIYPGRSATTHLLNLIHDINCTKSVNFREMRTKKNNKESKTEQTGQDDVLVTQSVMYEDDVSEFKPIYNGDPAPKDTESAKGTAKNDLRKAAKVKWEYNVCPFENVKVIVVDEFSIEYAEIFSKLLAAVCSCGAPELLVVLGDEAQMPSIKHGNLLRDFSGVAREIGMYAPFKHNHRVEPGSFILKKNCELIAAGKTNLTYDDKVFVNIPISIDYNDKANQANTGM
jgi:hypothetical protein